MNANEIKAFFEKGMEVCSLIREGSNPHRTRQDAEDYVRAEECYQEIRGYFDRGRNDGYFTCAEMEDILATVLSVIHNKKEK